MHVGRQNQRRERESGSKFSMPKPKLQDKSTRENVEGPSRSARKNAMQEDYSKKRSRKQSLSSQQGKEEYGRKESRVSTFDRSSIDPSRTSSKASKDSSAKPWDKSEGRQNRRQSKTSQQIKRREAPSTTSSLSKIYSEASDVSEDSKMKNPKLSLTSQGSKPQEEPEQRTTEIEKVEEKAQEPIEPALPEVSAAQPKPKQNVEIAEPVHEMNESKEPSQYETISINISKAPKKSSRKESKQLDDEAGGDKKKVGSKKVKKSQKTRARVSKAKPQEKESTSSSESKSGLQDNNRQGDNENENPATEEKPKVLCEGCQTRPRPPRNKCFQCWKKLRFYVRNKLMSLHVKE